MCLVDAPRPGRRCDHWEKRGTSATENVQQCEQAIGQIRCANDAQVSDGHQAI
jgi:hypothetical protein